jgi:hypothetical protein
MLSITKKPAPTHHREREKRVALQEHYTSGRAQTQAICFTKNLQVNAADPGDVV